MRGPLLLAAALTVAAAPARAQRADTISLTLGTAVRRSVGETPSVTIANLEADIAAARVRQSRAALLPTLSANASWVNRSFNIHSLGIDLSSFGGQTALPDRVGPFSTVDARGTLTETLFDYSSLLRIRAAGAGRDAAVSERDVVAERAAEGTALAYLQVLRGQATVRAREEDVRLARDLVVLADAQVRAGVSTAIDVTRARTQLTSAQGMLLVAQNEEQQAEIALARALGLDPGTPFHFTDTLSTALGISAAPTDLPKAEAFARDRRPELTLEREQAQRARLARSAAGAERLPRLDVEADWGFNGPAVDRSITTRQVAVQVTVPILDGFRREGRIAEQSAAASEANVRLDDLQRQVRADVQSALLDLGSARQQEEVATQGLSLAEQELAQARSRFASGVVGNLDVISAQRSLVRARDAVINARYAAAVARVRLARATGVAATVH